MGIRFFDMFAGIGGFRSGLEAVGGYECVGSCEIDPYARKAYETLYKNTRVRLEFRDRAGYLHRGGLRKLTPREYWRLQGFTDAQFDAVSAQGFSDTRLYKMAGNAVTVPVISFLAEFLRDVWEAEVGV